MGQVVQGAFVPLPAPAGGGGGAEGDFIPKVSIELKSSNICALSATSQGERHPKIQTQKRPGQGGSEHSGTARGNERGSDKQELYQHLAGKHQQRGNWPISQTHQSFYFYATYTLFICLWKGKL